MRPQAKLLNAYFEAALGRSLALSDGELISRQRANLMDEFGPERLSKMSHAELLRCLPYNLSHDQPLDYWLEFRNDACFQTQLFGGIAGGSTAKFGLWQDRSSGQWRAKPPCSRSIQDISEIEALGIVEIRRREMLAAVEALRPFTRCPVEHLDPAEIQAAIEAAAPRWKASAWLHKYLHLNYPELVTWRATRAYLQSDLYRLGIAADGSGPYVLDIKLIQFWSSLPALAQIPIPLRYRLTEGLTPRDHWCFRLTDEDPDGSWLLANGMIALGPARVGNLAGVFSLSRKTQVRRSIELAFQDAGIVAGPRCLQDLLNLGYGLKEGDLVALLDNARTVRAVGKVTAGYCHAFNAERPHRVPIRWLHQRRFDFSAPINRGTGNLFGLFPEDPTVAAIEASLLLNGSGEWPDFAATSGLRKIHQAGVVPQSLEPPQDRIAGQLIRMLERKKQVILYGPPGTGKTYYAEQTALEMVARHNFHCLPRQLSTGQTDRIWGREEGYFPFIALCTFHPLYAYEDFIEGYRPEREGFSLRPGLFRRMATAAQAQPDKRFVLIVDEINRGNIPKIFGELITLLEPAKRGVIQVQLPLSGERFSVPDNLYLIATMNTADHSILLLDVALRRRFGFRELRPDPPLLQQSRIGDLPLAVWLRVLNQRIVRCLRQEGRNLQVGHAYFMPRGEPVTDIRQIAEIVRENIWPLLQEYCYDDPQALATILAADEDGIYDCETADLRHELFEPGREKELIQALQNMVGPKYRQNTTDAHAGAVPEAVDAVIPSEIRG